MKVLGLDCASLTGWAIVEDGKYVSSGVESFKKKRGESNGIMFMKFRKWLIEKIQHNNIDMVGIESGRFRGGAATEICVGLQTQGQEGAAFCDVESYPVNTNTLKKFATGKGNAGKEEMIKAAQKKTGITSITSDDEADAIHIAFLTYKDLNPVLL